MGDQEEQERYNCKNEATSPKSPLVTSENFCTHNWSREVKVRMVLASPEARAHWLHWDRLLKKDAHVIAEFVRKGKISDSPVSKPTLILSLLCHVVF